MQTYTGNLFFFSPLSLFYPLDVWFDLRNKLEVLKNPVDLALGPPCGRLRYHLAG